MRLPLSEIWKRRSSRIRLRRGMYPAAKVFACLIVLMMLGSCTSPSSPQPLTLLFNHVRQRHSHNSYEKAENLMDQLTYHRIRAIELDLHWDAPPGEWRVYHDDPSKTNCQYLSECLWILKRFHNIDPTHEPVTVFLDFKEDGDPGRLDPPNGPHDLQKLEAAFTSILGDTSMYQPSKMRSDCSGASNLHLHQVVQRCGWPTVDQLKGMFLIVGPGGDKIFAMTDLCGPVDETTPDTVFYNINASEDDETGLPCARWGFDVWNKGYIARTWGSDTYWGQYNIQMPSTNQITGAMLRPRVTQANGYPFTYLLTPPPGTSLPNPTGFITLTATTGTMYQTRSDNMIFAYDNFPDGNALTASFSTAGSAGTKGGACLMLRNSLSPDSPYVGSTPPSVDSGLAVLRSGESAT
jgi:hypothetical protein